MNEDDESNVDSLLDDLFRMCHAANSKKNQLMTEADEDVLRKCYRKYMKSYSLVTQVSFYLEKKYQAKK